MILVNIKHSGKGAVTDEQLRAAAASAWVVSDDTIRMYGDHLAAVRDNQVLAVWRVVGFHRNDEGRAVFDLDDVEGDLVASLVGQPSPVQWVRGSANPVKIYDTEQGRPAASAIELTQQGNERVTLQGWSLIVYGDGRARISPPASKGKLIVESAFPGPDGGNVTVRLLAAVD